MGESANGVAGYITTRQAARLYGVSQEAIRQRVRLHRIPVTYVGRAMLLRASDLAATYQRACVGE